MISPRSVVAALAGLAVVMLIIGVVVVYVSPGSSTRPSQARAANPSLRPVPMPGTIPPHEPSNPAGLSEWTLARQIGFQAWDFPAGTVPVASAPGGPYETSPVPASTCTPVHSQPWVADYDSQTYDPSGIGNDDVYSEVLIMPAADASAALNAIGAPGYDTTCFQPGFDANARGMTPTSSCASLRFNGSSISELPSTGFPRGSVVDRYAATMTCTGNGVTAIWYTDVISATAGSAFIQGTFNSYDAPVSTQIEHTAMKAMAMRARSFRSGSA